MKNPLLYNSWFYSLFLTSCFPVLGIKLTSISIVIPLLTSLIIIIKHGKEKIKPIQFKWFIFSSLLYLSYVISVCFFPITNSSSFILEKKLSLLIFPIILILNPIEITKKQIQTILLLFASSTLLLVVITNVSILISGIPDKYILWNDFSYSYRTYFEDISRLHPTYISIYLAFSALIFLDFFLKKERYKIFYIFSFILCFIGMIPLAAKMPMIAFITSLFAFLLMQPKIWKKSKYLLLTFFIGISIAAVTIPALKIRVNEILDTKLSPPVNNNYNSINVRVAIFQSSFNLVKKNFVLGIGPAQIQEQLNLSYDLYKTNAFEKIKYNTHNEYFNIILGTGLLGVLSFISFLLLLFIKSYKTNPLFFNLLLILTFCFFTENLLDRQAGVVFFAFFTALFIRYSLIQKEEWSSHS